MQIFDYALIRYQGVNLIIVPVNSEFGNRNCFEQRRLQECIEANTTAQGLSGEVVLVWRGYTNRMKFLSRQSSSQIVKEINWGIVAKNITGKMVCSVYI